MVARRAAALLAVVLLAGCGGREDAPTPAERPAGTGLRYGVIGDSYSNGEGVGATSAWPAQLARRLGLDLVANPAVSGWTSEQALAEEVPALERADPDVVTVQIGTNDWVQGVSGGVFRQRFGRLLDEAIRITGGAQRVVAVTTPDFSVKPVGGLFGGGRDVTAGVRGFNEIIRAESRDRGVAVADVFGVSRRRSDPAADGLHPSARELAAWTDVIAPVARRRWRGLRRAPD